MKSVPFLHTLRLTGVDPSSHRWQLRLRVLPDRNRAAWPARLDDEDIRQLDALFLAQGEADY